jgi:hypothetical protein
MFAQSANYDKIFVMFQASFARFSAVTALVISAIPAAAQRAVVHEKDIVKTIVDPSINRTWWASANSTAPRRIRTFDFRSSTAKPLLGKYTSSWWKD